MPPAFSQVYGQKWSGLGLQKPQGRARTRFEQMDFDTLKQSYNQKYGYNIAVPEWEDVFKWKPNLLKTETEIKAEKKKNLERILASPSTDWFRSYSTLMTKIDNIQDTASVVYPAFRILMRWAPRVFSRFLPGMGWVLLAYDALQLANTMLRGQFLFMKGKRAACEMFRNNPFSKEAQWKRMDRIKKWNPTWSDILQAAQVTADTTGVGLQLGGIMGFIPDLIFGAYRKLTGERVSFNAELPGFKPWELKAAQGMKAAALIGSTGQTFDDELHLATYLTFAASTYFLSPAIEQFDIAGACDNPGEAIIDAPAPEDPLTIAVIKEAGLSVEDGVQWPWNREKKISLFDLTNVATEPTRETFRDFSFRNANSWQGYLAAHFMDDALFDLFDATDPQGEYVADDTPMTKLFFTMVKTPIIPDPVPSREQWKDVEKWVNDYAEFYGHMPRVPEIRKKFNQLGIAFAESEPAAMDPAVKALYPDPFDTSEWA